MIIRKDKTMNTPKTDKRRAVAYCRVSTDKEEQRTSIKNQRIELKRICERENWVMPIINVKGLCDAGVYYDIDSGTKIIRPALHRLLLDAGLTPIVDADTGKETSQYKIDRQPKFDLIVVKDASRFSRNININSIMQALKDNGVYVIFPEMNNMTTERNEDWSVIQQYIIFAEGESRRKSKAVSFGYEAGLKQGKIYFGGKMFGYDYDKKNNRLIINEEEAKVIRRVFAMYTEEGLGQHRICNALANEGIYTKRRDKDGTPVKYGRSTIKRWLENEKYCGITTGGRYHKIDLFSGKRIERDYDDRLRVEARKAQQKLAEQGIIKIEPIITVEQYEKAQQITARNAEMYKVSKEWKGTTDYAKKVVCGCCGAYYRASGKREYAKYDHQKITRYVCRHRITFDEAHGIPKCENPAILEPELDKALFGRSYWIHRRNNIEELISTGDFYISVLKSAINRDNAQAIKEIEEQITTISLKRERLLDLYADGIYSKDELEKRTVAFTDQISELSAKKEQLSKGNEAIYKDIEQINTMIQSAKEAQKEVEEILSKKKYPKQTRKELLRDVEQITIDAHGKPHITFKSLENIKNMIASMGIAIENYADAEEAGWEEELSEAEK